jgi:RHS repeat-associated protein
MIAAVTTDGAFHRLLGTFNYPPFALPPNGTLGRATDLSPFGVGISPDGSVYFTDFSINLVRRADNVFPRLSRGDTIIPSADASEVYVFGGGRHVRTLDPLTGLALLTFTYDTNGFVTGVTDIDGKETVIERETTGKPLAIVAPGGQRTTLTTGTGGKLASIANPANESYAFTYGPAGLLESLTDPRSGQHTYHYDVKGGVIDDQGPDGMSISLHRTDSGQSYSVTRTSAEGRTHTYNVLNSPDTSESRVVVAPDGTTSKFTFADVTTTATAPDGSKATSITGASPRFGMQSPFTASSTTTAGGQTLKIFTTQTATLANSTDPLSLTRLSSTLTINNASWNRTYDKPTLTATTTSPLGRTVTLVTDAKGRPSSVARPLRAPVSFSYTSGQLTTLQQGSRAVAFSYDGKQRLATITDPLNRVSSFGYDDADRVISQTLPDGRVVTFSYDPNGNLTSVTPPSRPPHAFAFTAGDQAASYTPPTASGAGATTYRYNRDRQLTAIIRPDGTAVALSYDAALGTLTSLGIARGSYLYSYDQQSGVLSSVTAPDNGQLSLGYTTGLLTSTTWTGPVSGSIRWSYDNFLTVASETIGTDTISFGYDGDRLLTRAGALTLTYGPQSGLLVTSSIGTISDAYTYNEFAEPAQYTASTNGNNLFAQQFTRDAVGRIQHTVETIAGDAHAIDYVYDDAGRLTGVMRDGNTTATYRYDENNNRVARIVGSAGDVASYDAQDRLLTYGASTYQYSANGELAAKTTDVGTSRYAYDEIGNLLSVNLPDGTKVEYIVDGANRRIGKKLNGVLVQSFLYSSGLRVAAELNGSGNLVSRFVYGTRVNVPDYMIRGGVTYRIISDHLGSPRLIVDTATGLVMQRMDYDEFGNVLYDSLPGFQPFGFAGGLYDVNTGLVRFGARDYEAATGRWTTKDPIGFAGGDTSFYGYAGNDPVNLLDLDGLKVYPANFVGPLQKSDSRSYAADLSDPRLAPLTRRWGAQAPQFYGTDDQCVSLTREFTGAPCHACWHPGMPVMNNSDIPIGTAIATMPYGYYPGKEESHKNSGIYLGQGVNASGQPGIVIIDQWPGHKARMRVITEGGQFPGDFSNDADAYYVITTPAVRDCGCGKQ